MKQRGKNDEEFCDTYIQPLITRLKDSSANDDEISDVCNEIYSKLDQGMIDWSIYVLL